MIRTLPEDGVIREPGAYRISMEVYHGQPCEGPSISSSGIRTIVNESPWHFWSQSNLNPNRYPETEQSDALTLGKATHALVLGDEVFDEHFIYVPGDAPRRPTQQQITAYEQGRSTDVGKQSVEWWRDFEVRAAGRALLTDTQIQHIGYMAENVRKSPEAMLALTGGLTEVSLIWRDEITGVWLKSRPDVIPDNGWDAADLKTFAPRHKDLGFAVQRAITDHGYMMQMALAAMGAEAVFGVSTSEYVLVFVQSSPPYCVIPVRLDEEALYLGKVLCRHGIDTFARCLDRNEWPGPVEGIMTYTVPPSISGRIYDLQTKGEMPNVSR
jgi:hypothetical protein